MKPTSLLALPFLLFFLLSCKTAPLIGENPPDLFELPPTVVWGTAADKPIYAGGFSGLIYLGKNPKNSEHQFMTITDRGPNIDPQDRFRTFLLPTYQPRLVKLETNKKNKTISIIGETLFTDPKGEAITGLPQIASDQAPVDQAGNPLPFDPLGMDSESLAVDKDGNYWVSEEYRPSLLKFSKRGRLIKRYLPKGSLPPEIINRINNKFAGKIVEEVLPEAFNSRNSNRGFESITIREGLVYAILESPVIKESGVVAMIEFSPRREKVLRELEYPLIDKRREKISDMAVLDNGNFIVIEQNSRDHIVAEFSLPKEGKVLEPKEILNLGDQGFSFAEKIEGLAAFKEGADQFLAVTNDNDFGLNQSSKKIGLGIFKLKSK
jgi:hypothetical protein